MWGSQVAAVAAVAVAVAVANHRGCRSSHGGLTVGMRRSLTCFISLLAIYLTARHAFNGATTHGEKHPGTAPSKVKQRQREGQRHHHSTLCNYLESCPECKFQNARMKLHRPLGLVLAAKHNTVWDSFQVSQYRHDPRPHSRDRRHGP